MAQRFHHTVNILRTCGVLCELTNVLNKTQLHQCISRSVRTHCHSRCKNLISCSCGRDFSTHSFYPQWTSRSITSLQPKFTYPLTFEEETEVMPADIQEMANISEQEGWISVGQYNVFAWSLSGVESCIVIKSEDVLVAFDMGSAVPESIKAANIFITHGHVDHIGAVSNHVAKRSLNGMKPARYYVPPYLVDNLKLATKAHYDMAQTTESLENVKVMSIAEGESVRLNSRYFVKAFPTIHRIPSQGYILYKEEKVLKEEYKGMEGFEVAALHRQGKEIHDVVVTPEIAYTGDTTFDIFTNPPTPDLLKAKLLITEATFLDEDLGRSVIQKARDRGHTHLSEFAQNPELFDNVGHIILVHFSNRYPCKYITDSIRDKLPAQLRRKVTPATVAKATTAVSYNSIC